MFCSYNWRHLLAALEVLCLSWLQKLSRSPWVWKCGSRHCFWVSLPYGGWGVMTAIISWPWDLGSLRKWKGLVTLNLGTSNGCGGEEFYWVVRGQIQYKTLDSILEEYAVSGWVLWKQSLRWGFFRKWLIEGVLSGAGIQRKQNQTGEEG